MSEPISGDFEGDIDLSKRKATLPSILTYEEIDRFLSIMDDFKDMIACRLMLFGGLRVSEASELLVKDVEPERGAVFVNQGKGGKDRWAPIDVHTISLCRSYARETGLDPTSCLISFSKRTIQRHVRDIAEKAGIIWGVTAHTLRHTCATWQLDKGIPLEVVRENLGHKDISTTQIYLHLNIRQRSRTYHDATRFGV